MLKNESSMKATPLAHAFQTAEMYSGGTIPPREECGEAVVISRDSGCDAQLAACQLDALAQVISPFTVVSSLGHLQVIDSYPL